MSREKIRSTLIIAARAALAVSMVLIMYEATIRKPDEVPGVESDKLMHALAFCWLALLADPAFPSGGFGLRSMVPLFAFGVLIELVQLFLPWRSAEVADLLADGTGLVVYAFVSPLLRRVSPLHDLWFG